MMLRSPTLSLALLSLMMVVSVPAPAVAAPSVTSTIDVGTGPQSVAFSPNGTKAYVANSGGVENDTVSVITVATGEVAADPISVGVSPSSVAFSPNGKKAYVTNVDDGTVSVIKTR